MTLKIAGKSFRVESATLGGALFHKSWQKFDPTIGDGLEYFIDIRCEAKSVLMDGHEQEWEPELILGRFRLAVESWPEIEASDIHNVEGCRCRDGCLFLFLIVRGWVGKQTGMSQFGIKFASRFLGEKRKFNTRQDVQSEQNQTEQNQSCSVCLLALGKHVACMPCSAKHAFHESCIGEWLKVSNTCPVCRGGPS